MILAPAVAVTDGMLAVMDSMLAATNGVLAATDDMLAPQMVISVSNSSSEEGIGLALVKELAQWHNPACT